MPITFAQACRHYGHQDYRPQLLGTSVEEAGWRLLHRVHEGILHARGTTFPIIQALYADDGAAVVTHQLEAATMDARIVADALHTILCLGAGKFEPGEREPLRGVLLAACWPLEAVNLYYPQAQFFSSPYWGNPRVGAVLEGGTKARPLRLRLPGAEVAAAKEFADGLGVGMGHPLTWLLPKDVYQRFTVIAGLHPELGAKGRVEFTILGDGRTLATAIGEGGEPAHTFDCDITGVAKLQLAATARGSDPKSNYAIWAEPTLVKKPDRRSAHHRCCRPSRRKPPGTRKRVPGVSPAKSCRRRRYGAGSNPNGLEAGGRDRPDDPDAGERRSHENAAARKPIAARKLVLSSGDFSLEKMRA